MTRRITITLPDELVSAIDEEAAEEGLSRSALIREASARYVAGLQDQDAEAARREAVDETVEFLEGLAARVPLDQRPTLEVLREVRGPIDMAAPWDDEAGEGP